MAIRPVLKMGDPRLLEVAQKVKKFNTPELNALIQHAGFERMDSRIDDYGIFTVSLARKAG